LCRKTSPYNRPVTYHPSQPAYGPVQLRRLTGIVYLEKSVPFTTLYHPSLPACGYVAHYPWLQGLWRLTDRVCLEKGMPPSAERV
jgi:hypothetical protein